MSLLHLEPDRRTQDFGGGGGYLPNAHSPSSPPPQGEAYIYIATSRQPEPVANRKWPAP